MKRKVLVAMSGGVDSSVAALLLLEQGFEVVGATMFLGLSPSEQSIQDAIHVCELLGVPHSILDLSKDLEEVVIRNFVFQYERGRTPNPCILCNRKLKFGKLLEYAQDNGFDFLATGHYARIRCEGGQYFIQRPRDKKKDQTYFLYAIEREKLPFLLFPLGEFSKEEVRKRASQAGLAVARKPQSQDICFLLKDDYRKFLAERIKKDFSGSIVTTNGMVLGKHEGYFRYTIGQRKGLGVNSSHPLYVVAIRPERREVVVGKREKLQSRGLVASSCNFFFDEVPQNLFAQVRYSQREKPCFLKFLDAQRVRVLFEEAVEMVAPGQSVVFYRDEVLVGGGIIEEVF
ncbi:MAG: tRNA 2-thiouridine(34) synthase MnmA [Candidatus Caldatribacteriaceae bacterium]